MDIKDFMPALKETVIAAGSLVESVTGTTVFSTAENILDINDVWKRVKLERNLRAYLEGLKEGDSEKIKSTIDRIQKGARADDFVILLLDVIATSVRPLKAELLSGLLTAFSNDEIDDQFYEECSLLISESSSLSLMSLKDFYASTDGDSVWKGRLADAHHTEPMLNSLGVASRHGSQLRISSLGEAIYKYGFRGQVNNSTELSYEFTIDSGIIGEEA